MNLKGIFVFIVIMMSLIMRNEKIVRFYQYEMIEIYVLGPKKENFMGGPEGIY